MQKLEYLSSVTQLYHSEKRHPFQLPSALNTFTCNIYYFCWSCRIEQKSLGFNSQNRKQWRSLGGGGGATAPLPPIATKTILSATFPIKMKLGFFLPASQRGNKVIRTPPTVSQGDFPNSFNSDNKCLGNKRYDFEITSLYCLSVRVKRNQPADQLLNTSQ